MDIILHSHVPVEMVSRTWHADRAVERRNLYTSPRWLVLLTTILFIQIGIIEVSTVFLAKQAYWWHNSLLLMQGPLAAFLLAQILSRSKVDEEVGGRIYWMTSDAFDVAAMALAGVGMLGAVVAIGLVSLGLYQCYGTYDSLSALVDFIFLGQQNMTLVEAYRSASFATDLIWFQLCLDDFAMAVVYLCFVGSIVLVDAAVIIFELNVMNTTRRMIRRYEDTPQKHRKITVVAAGGEEEEEETLL